MERKNITLIAQYFADIEDMEDEYKDYFTLAMVKYGMLGREPDFSVFESKERKFMAVIWQNIKRQLDFAISQRDKAKRKRGPREDMENNQIAAKPKAGTQTDDKEMTDDQAEANRIFLCGLGVYNTTALEYIKQVRANGRGINRSYLKKLFKQAAEEYGATPQQCIEAATDRGEENRGFCLGMIRRTQITS